jgi:hypothetical protein
MIASLIVLAGLAGVAVGAFIMATPTVSGV